MSKHVNPTPSEFMDPLGDQLRQYSRAFAYPPTPDLSKVVRSRLEQGPTARPGPSNRRLAWTLMALLIILALIFTVPTVRAQILEFIQLGRIKIFLVEPTPAPTTTPPPPTSTPWPADFVRVLSEVAGETSLAEAPGEVSYPVKLPAYPPGLGKPDYVFVQDLGAPVLVLVWMDPDHPEQAHLSLSLIPEGSFVMEKFKPISIQETQVNGQPAIWTLGPHILRLKNGDIDLRRVVDGNVLIWEDKSLTYRLESSLSQEEALKIAESLKPYTP